MKEILLEEVYHPDTGVYLGKVTIFLDDLKKVDLIKGGILDNIDKGDTMGFKRHREALLKQHEYILRKPVKV